MISATAHITTTRLDLSPSDNSLFILQARYMCDCEKELTNHEKEILRYVCEGLSNKEISIKRNLKLTTLKTYITKIMVKAEVKTRYELMAKFRSRE